MWILTEYLAGFNFQKIFVDLDGIFGGFQQNIWRIKFAENKLFWIYAEKEGPEVYEKSLKFKRPSGSVEFVLRDNIKFNLYKIYFSLYINEFAFKHVYFFRFQNLDILFNIKRLKFKRSKTSGCKEIWIKKYGLSIKHENLSRGISDSSPCNFVYI